MKLSYRILAVLVLSGAAAGVLAGCATAKKGKSDEREIVKLTPFFVANPKDSEFLRSHLKKFGLAPLVEDRRDFIERYRFLWARSFHPAACFEVEYRADGTGTYRAMVSREEGGVSRCIVEKTHRVDRKHLDFYRYMIASYKMFDLPWYDDRSGYDGSSWLIEMVRGDQHHELYRWSPEDGPVRTFGNCLIEEAIDSVFIPIY